MKGDNRQPGYYWVKYNQFWKVAEYSQTADRWILAGIGQWYRDDDFREIDENRIERIPMTIPKEWNKITPDKE